MSDDKLAKIPSIEDAAEKLRDQIRSAFVELIPPEQWTEMVKREIQSFRCSSQDSYGRTKEPVLTKVCREEFERFVSRHLKELLEGSEYRVNLQSELSTAIEEWLKKNAGQLVELTVATLAGKAAQSVVDAMKWQT